MRLGYLHVLSVALAERNHPDLYISLDHMAWRVELKGERFTISARAPVFTDALAQALAQFDRAMGPTKTITTLTEEFLANLEPGRRHVRPAPESLRLRGEPDMPRLGPPSDPPKEAP